ncbi:STAS domain-containing protein [Micromonospora aurantiaca (nom. illeg.)]|uniref:STAS domain-containing protein n=1 Tax=Micromonospora aurantiaca (nom. illeg.) TaxID=47850 RepID=UPI0035AFCA2D
MDLTITTSGEDPLLRLSLTGRLGAATSGLVYGAVLAALRVDTVRDVDLDLIGVTRFDAAATSTLVACHRAVHVRGGTLRLVNIPQPFTNADPPPPLHGPVRRSIVNRFLPPTRRRPMAPHHTLTPRAVLGGTWPHAVTTHHARTHHSRRRRPRPRGQPTARPRPHTPTPTLRSCRERCRWPAT